MSFDSTLISPKEQLNNSKHTRVPSAYDDALGHICERRSVTMDAVFWAAVLTITRTKHKKIKDTRIN